MIRILTLALLMLSPQFAVPLHTYIAPSTPMGACVTTPNVTSLAITLTIAPGSTTVVHYGNDNSNGTNVSSLTDTAGNTWSGIGPWTGGTLAWECTNCTGRVNDVITLGFSGTSNPFQVLAGVNYPAVASTATDGSNGGRASNPQSTGNITTTHAPDLLVVGSIYLSSTTTVVTSMSGGWTKDYTCATTGGSGGTQPIEAAFYSLNETSTGTYSGSVSYPGAANNVSNAGIIAFKH